jgi:hypothetical protein
MFRLKQMASTMVQTLSGNLNFIYPYYSQTKIWVGSRKVEFQKIKIFFSNFDQNFESPLFHLFKIKPFLNFDQQIEWLSVHVLFILWSKLKKMKRGFSIFWSKLKKILNFWKRELWSSEIISFNHFPKCQQ